MVGSLACIAYSEKIGRLRTIFIGIVLSIIALAIESSAYSLAQFVVGRVLVGMSIGTISAAVPVWQSECSSSSHRGAFVLVEGISISAGITLSEWISFGFSFIKSGSVNWRLSLVFPVILPLFVIPWLWIMPESPRWLALHGREEEARATLAALEDTDPYSSAVNREIAQIELSMSEIKGSLKELTRNGKERVLNRTLLAMCAQMFQQMCGISALVFYTSTVFIDMGFKGTTERVLGACLTTFQTCSSFVAVFTIDRIGRRRLFMTSAAGMAVCMAVVAGTASSKEKSVGNVAIAFFFLYDFFYPLGFLGQTFLYASEISPLRVRVPITALANATQWMCQFIVAQVTPIGTTNLGTKYYIIFAVINSMAVVIVFLFFPETSGRSLEDIDHIFEHSSGYFGVVKAAKRFRVRDAAEVESNSSPVRQHYILSDVTKAVDERKEDVSI